ncbi:MAG TPA: glycoside hydrolase family 97 catalytic domain-containing protein [Bacteroidaceae bacterium]|nr:glycoside hydrolase family 97 catalytic domain-containing protein [Bacteroidaceae bacterium]
MKLFKFPFLLSIVLSLFCTNLKAVESSVSSPDGNLVVTLFDRLGEAFYSVNYKGKAFLLDSPLGLVTDIGDFSKNLTLKPEVKIVQVSDSYSLPNIKFSQVEYSANQGIFTFVDINGKAVFDVVFNVSNNDIAFKYVLAPQRNLCCVIKEEKTGFVFPDETTTFLSPQMMPMSGFARTAPSYEASYTLDDQMGKNAGGRGFTFPCLFRESDNGWVLLCETGVGSNYCGSRLMGGQDSKYTIGYPMEEEFNGIGTVSPGITVPGETPWRTITLGETLAPIVETTIMWDVVKPLYEASQKYQFGRSTWSWIIRMDASCNYEEQVEYIDFSADLGYEYVLIDALWDQNIGYDKIEDLAKYAASKNVGILLWYNSNGYWNDAPQGPKGIMGNTIARREEMKWLKSIGIKGLKVDFFGSDKQQTMQLYEDILYDANEYGLMVVFHGCTIQRGWERMYPNFASGEAVRASENLSFGQAACDEEALNACLHPFIRNTIGNMDFGGSALNKRYSKGNNRGTYRVTSDVYAIATAVLFQSSLQHFALAPNNLTDAPAWAIDFMKTVPTTWDEVKYIDGYPGKYVILARRSGEKWYIVGINAQEEELKVKTTLSMLDSNTTFTHYSDDSSLNGSVNNVKLNRKKEFEWIIPCNGGEMLVSD